MKFLTEQKILYLKQLALGRIFPLHMPLLIVLHITQILHILTNNLHSPGNISFSVSKNQPAKICPKVNYL